jgi:hypothetical protein
MLNYPRILTLHAHDEIAFKFGQQGRNQAAQAAGVRLRVDLIYDQPQCHKLARIAGKTIRPRDNFIQDIFQLYAVSL